MKPRRLTAGSAISIPHRINDKKFRGELHSAGCPLQRCGSGRFLSSHWMLKGLTFPP
jgi:hypothetical protein